MSLLAHTPICDEALRTQLGDAFQAHFTAHHANAALALGPLDLGLWLNVIHARASRANDPKFASFIDRMLSMLNDPVAFGPTFKSDFYALYDQAGRHTYPLAWLLRREIHEFAGITTYSEALVYHLLKERGGERLTIAKLPGDGPDFKCSLRVAPNDRHGDTLSFFVEVKSLNIANPRQRLAEMLDDGLDTQIELERQRKLGWSIVVAALDGELVVKRLRHRRGQTWLEPDSDDVRYQPIEIVEGSNFEIWGVVKHTIRDHLV